MVANSVRRGAGQHPIHRAAWQPRASHQPIHRHQPPPYEIDNEANVKIRALQIAKGIAVWNLSKESFKESDFGEILEVGHGGFYECVVADSVGGRVGPSTNSPAGPKIPDHQPIHRGHPPPTGNAAPPYLQP